MIYTVVKNKNEVTQEDGKQTLVKLSKIVNFKNKDISLFSLYKDGESSGEAVKSSNVTDSKEDKRLVGMNMF